MALAQKTRREYASVLHAPPPSPPPPCWSGSVCVARREAHLLHCEVVPAAAQDPGQDPQAPRQGQHGELPGVWEPPQGGGRRRGRGRGRGRGRDDLTRTSGPWRRPHGGAKFLRVYYGVS